MGFTAGLAYSNGEWQPDELPLTSAGDGELGLMIHDSDMALVMYQPLGSGSGEGTLGPSPFAYFGLDDEPMPTAGADEALGLAEWWAHRRGGAEAEELHTKRTEHRPALHTGT